MTYKGYSARIEYEDEDSIMTGQIAGIRDGVGFQADSVEELKEAFHEAVDDYVETCAKIGKEPQKSYSGRVMFRVDPEVHRRAALLKMRPGRMATDATTHASGNADGSWGFAPRAILDGVGDRPFSGA